MTIRFDGRVAIVTGAGGGLGRCHALGLAARGAKVVVNDLGKGGAAPDSALKVVEEIKSAGGVALAEVADVADFEAVAAMIARIEKEWGRIDILVNNAGILRDKTFAKMEMSDFARVVWAAPPTAAKQCGTACASATIGASSSRPRRPAFTAISARPITVPRRRR